MLRIVVAFCLLFALVNGNVVRTVTHHEDAPWEQDDQLEEFPPPQDWFRVRGGATRAQALSHGESDVVVLNSRDQDVQITPRRGEVQVQVRTRGRTGFQNQEGRLQESFSRRRSEDTFDDDLSNVPREITSSAIGNSRGREENWHLPIRHEGGRHRENVQIVSQNTGSRRQGSQAQVPREPGEEEFSKVESGTFQNRGRGNTPLVPENRGGSSSSSKSRASGNDDYVYDYEDDQVVNQNTKNVIRNKESRQQVSGQLQSRRNDDDVIIVLDDDNGRRRISNGLDNGDIIPPPHEQVAKMARYIVRNANWTSVATISTRSPIKGFPFANVFSVSDGPVNNSTGVPLMYLTPLEMSVIDLQTDSRASMTMSLAQTDYCRRQEYDPEDPRCAHVILSGNIRPITSANERNFARNALFSKHPEMQSWPKDHGWFFAKMDIRNIIVLDYFGGANTVTLDDYFNASSL